MLAIREREGRHSKSIFASRDQSGTVADGNARSMGATFCGSGWMRVSGADKGSITSRLGGVQSIPNRRRFRQTHALRRARKYSRLSLIFS